MQLKMDPTARSAGTPRTDGQPMRNREKERCQGDGLGLPGHHSDRHSWLPAITGRSLHFLTPHLHVCTQCWKNKPVCCASMVAVLKGNKKKVEHPSEQVPSSGLPFEKQQQQKKK